MTKKLFATLLAAAAIAASAVVLHRLVPDPQTPHGTGLYFLFYGLAASAIWWLAAAIGYGIGRKCAEASTFMLPLLVAFPWAAFSLVMVVAGAPWMPVRVVGAVMIGLFFAASLLAIPLNRAPPEPPSEETKSDAL